MAESMTHSVTADERSGAEPMAWRIIRDLGLEGHPNVGYFRQRLVNSIVAVRRAAASIKG